MIETGGVWDTHIIVFFLRIFENEDKLIHIFFNFNVYNSVGDMDRFYICKQRTWLIMNRNKYYSRHSNKKKNMLTNKSI